MYMHRPQHLLNDAADDHPLASLPQRLQKLAAGPIPAPQFPQNAPP
jgi:hypothetical protein